MTFVREHSVTGDVQIPQRLHHELLLRPGHYRAVEVDGDFGSASPGWRRFGCARDDLGFHIESRQSARSGGSFPCASEPVRMFSNAAGPTENKRSRIETCGSN